MHTNTHTNTHRNTHRNTHSGRFGDCTRPPMTHHRRTDIFDARDVDHGEGTNRFRRIGSVQETTCNGATSPSTTHTTTPSTAATSGRTATTTKRVWASPESAAPGEQSQGSGIRSRRGQRGGKRGGSETSSSTSSLTRWTPATRLVIQL